MIYTRRQHELSSPRQSATSLIALLLVFVCVQTAIAQQSPRLAQNTGPPTAASPWEIIKAIGGSPLAPSEALPAPLPANPQGNPQGNPNQHVIPFAAPDPNAEILFKQKDGLISLTVHDGSLRHTITMIAEAQGLNIVFAAPADIGITASLEGVPWQQALDSLLSASGYAWTNKDSIIFVVSLETANYMAPGSGGRQSQVFELDFSSAIDVDQAAKGLLSPGGASWVLESSSTDSRRSKEAIVVFDFPTHLQRINDLILQLDQPPRQVLIETNILQVSLSEECRNGVNFESITSFRGNEISLSTIGLANPAATSAFFLQTTGSALTNLVELLQTTSDAKTLASPRLLVISGQQARIQVGDQLGFRITTTTQTSSLESVKFLDVGVVLTVEPRITRDGRVLMRINPKVSTGQVDPDTGLPAEETTEIETDIFLNDGQGMVIGGLIQEQDSIVQSKIPWLGDLRYVGLLFQRRRALKERTEIIITLIPHIQPYSPNLACRESFELMQTQERLTEGPLHRASRPYEPRLYDAITNPRPTRMAMRRLAVPSHQNEPTPLPATEDSLESPPVILLPEEAERQ